MAGGLSRSPAQASSRDFPAAAHMVRPCRIANMCAFHARLHTRAAPLRAHTHAGNSQYLATHSYSHLALHQNPTSTSHRSRLVRRTKVPFEVDKVVFMSCMRFIVSVTSGAYQSLPPYSNCTTASCLTLGSSEPRLLNPTHCCALLLRYKYRTQSPLLNCVIAGNLAHKTYKYHSSASLLPRVLRRDLCMSSRRYCSAPLTLQDGRVARYVAHMQERHGAAVGRLADGSGAYEEVAALQPLVEAVKRHEAAATECCELHAMIAGGCSMLAGAS